MGRLRHIVCAFLVCAGALGLGGDLHAQLAPDLQNQPAARLIRPRAEPRPVERVRPRAPVDERCKVLKEQLEGALLGSANSHRVFQARLAHNAGTRLCREGQVERGMAEFQKGLSYLPDSRHP